MSNDFDCDLCVLCQCNKTDIPLVNVKKGLGALITYSQKKSDHWLQNYLLAQQNLKGKVVVHETCRKDYGNSLLVKLPKEDE